MVRVLRPPNGTRTERLFSLSPFRKLSLPRTDPHSDPFGGQSLDRSPVTRLGVKRVDFYTSLPFLLYPFSSTNYSSSTARIISHNLETHTSYGPVTRTYVFVYLYFRSRPVLFLQEPWGTTRRFPADLRHENDLPYVVRVPVGDFYSVNRHKGDPGSRRVYTRSNDSKSSTS